ncbi:hypothetical protein MATL_G00019150, partial [Megalops atlanticus]
EERQRAAELLEKGPPGLDNTLYQVEKEIEEKEEQLALYCTSADQLQQLQQTYEFTANVARQEEKVRRKEKEILESREKQQREALEQAVAKLERRHSAHLRRSSTIELEIEEQRRRLSLISRTQAALQPCEEAEPGALEQDRERLALEIQELKQRLSEGEGSGRGHCAAADDKSSHSSSPVSPRQSLTGVLPLADDRINAYIEEEVQRRLQKMNLFNGDNNIELSFSTESLREDERSQSGADLRKLKYKGIVSRSLGPITNSPKDPVKIGIPRYVLRGQGKDEHYEFEVKITVLDETWTVFRRYSRFREMHKTLKLKYPELAALDFPPKKLFGNRDERMVAERRTHLERYLRNFFRVMLNSSSSPLHAEKTGLQLSKHAICEFSPFFKKGVFDYSSHGTG